MSAQNACLGIYPLNKCPKCKLGLSMSVKDLLGFNRVLNRSGARANIASTRPRGARGSGGAARIEARFPAKMLVTQPRGGLRPGR